MMWHSGETAERLGKGGDAAQLLVLCLFFQEPGKGKDATTGRLPGSCVSLTDRSGLEKAQEASEGSSNN